MSFVRHKIIDGHRYYYLVRSVRVGKTVRQEHIQYLGKSPKGMESAPEHVEGHEPETKAANAKVDSIEALRRELRAAHKSGDKEKARRIAERIMTMRSKEENKKAVVPKGAKKETVSERNKRKMGEAVKESREEAWRMGYRQSHPGVTDKEINKYIKEQKRLEGAAKRERSVVPKKSKRVDYKKLTPTQAQKMIDESHGMPKAKWERLWKIAHSHPKATASKHPAAPTTKKVQEYRLNKAKEEAGVPESIRAHERMKARHVKLLSETQDSYYYNFPKKRLYLIRALDDNGGYHLYPRANGELPSGYASERAAKKEWGHSLETGEVKLVRGSQASKYPVPKRY